MKIEILYEDEKLIIVNKPHGLIVHGTVDKKRENLFDLLKRQTSLDIDLIHRLDKETSGAILFSKNKEINPLLDSMMKDHTIEKKYWAIVSGELVIDQKVELFLKKVKNQKKQDIMIKVEKGGVKAITTLKTIKHNSQMSLIECTLHTGRMHQIRATLLSLNHPIIGDLMYGNIQGERMFLHSKFLRLNLHGKEIIVDAAIDQEFQKMVSKI